VPVGLGADAAAAWMAAALARCAAASLLAAGCARAADVDATPSLHIADPRPAVEGHGHVGSLATLPMF